MTRAIYLCMVVVICLSSGFAQQSTAGSSATPVNATVPMLMNFSGTLTDTNGKPVSGIVGVTFYLYKDQDGGSPLWMETQNVRPAKTGYYSVMLGSTTSQGLPSDLFVSGEARWLGVQAQGQVEQARVMLLSVPYALKAGDAQTVGGLPPSAFVLAAPSTSPNGQIEQASASRPLPSSAPPPVGSVTGSGTTDFLPLWTGSSTIGNSVLFQSGTGSTAKIGLNTTAPLATLHVKGATIIAGLLTLPATVPATAASGAISQPENIAASSFNSITHAPVNQTFQWKAEPVGNNTANPSATLNLLFGSGTAPVETGFHIAGNGRISFASGQTFPGTGSGTVTQVNTGTGLTGGPITTTGTLAIDTTKVPLLASANTFTGNQSVTGNVSASGTATASTVISDGTVNVDFLGTNTGTGIPGVAFGLAGSGETIASDRSTAGVNPFGLDFYTNHAPRMAVTNGGFLGVGTQNPTYQLEVDATSVANGAVHAIGFSAAQFSGNGGSDGIDSVGGDGDFQSSQSGAIGLMATGGSGIGGGAGVAGFGGSGTKQDAMGGFFLGANTIFGGGGDGVYGSAGSGYAGNFAGDLFVSGAIFAGTKDFKIDHPLDPANKYLVHASVESSEMKNIYDGVVTTDAQGEATVQLPDWFEVLNTDFRYQLTVIGQFAQAIVGRKIQDHQFLIRTNAPNVEVSWQITGVRQDAYAKAHPLVVEEEKDARLRGFYIHPELYGAPPEKQIEWARHPLTMKRIKEMRAKQQATMRATANSVDENRGPGR
jgi:hypothetical protein